MADRKTMENLDNLIMGIEKVIDMKAWDAGKKDMLATSLEHAVRARRYFSEGNEKKACMNLRISMDFLENATGKKARRTA